MNIRDLRDHLAHANYYAETPAAARQVCQVVRKIRRIQADLAYRDRRSIAPLKESRRGDLIGGRRLTKALICYNQTTGSAHKYHGRESYAADILEGH